uniref:Uncharacterized protein n=1 Tax=Steinernema glaseri TaxID=37863 RepID=A0A1I7YXH5_9BILA
MKTLFIILLVVGVAFVCSAPVFDDNVLPLDLHLDESAFLAKDKYSFSPPGMEKHLPEAFTRNNSDPNFLRFGK